MNPTHEWDDIYSSSSYRRCSICAKASYLCPDGQETGRYLMALLLSSILEKGKSIHVEYLIGHYQEWKIGSVHIFSCKPEEMGHIKVINRH